MPVPLLKLATSLLAPPRCGACGEPCDATAAVCAGCSAALGPRAAGAGRSGSIDVVWAAPYDGAARQLVAALKFRGRLELARVAGAAVAAAAEAGLELRGRVVVPVPSAPLRRHRRGFDPGELIAQAAAERLGAPLAACLARRTSRRQVGRSRADRLANPPRVRVVAEPPVSALLVDDVLTTGATLRACAAALEQAGCGEISAAVLARALGARQGEA